MKKKEKWLSIGLFYVAVTLIGVTANCQVMSIPFGETFSYPFPTYIAPTYNGWEGPPNNGISGTNPTSGYQDATSSAWANYDGSMVMNLRCRDQFIGASGALERKPTYLISPEVAITEPDAIITWVETTYSGFWSGPKVSPRNLYVSTDGGTNWGLVDSYTSGSMPDAFKGEGWRRVTYPLGAYNGQTIRWKWEMLSTYYADATEAVKWEYTYWCIDNVWFGNSSIAYPQIWGDPLNMFGTYIWPPSVEYSYYIKNIGPANLHLEGISIEGSTEFKITGLPDFPVDLPGFLNSPGISQVPYKVEFLPTSIGERTATLVIHYNGTSVSIPMSGTGITENLDCANAVPVTDLNCSEGPPAACTKSILGPQDMLYSYTALYDQDVTITSCDPHNDAGYDATYAYDTYLKVFLGCPPDPSTVTLVNNDDQESRCGYNRASSSGSFHLTTNQTVYIYWPLLFPTAEHAFENFVFNITVTPTPPWPDGEFFADQTVITAGQSVNFTSNSTGNPTSWSWEFPGASQGTSTVENPAGITYPAAGNYQVKLTASNTNFSGNTTKLAYIVVGAVNAEPVPGGSEGFTVGGFKAGTSLPTGAWTFGDNNGYDMNWEIRNTGVSACGTDEPVMPSGTGASGYLVMPAVEYNCVNGNPASVEVDAFAQSPSFDCSGYDIVIYQFQQRFKINGQQPRMELQVSNDGGYNWKAFDVLQGRAIETIWGNPVETAKINITESAGRQSDVRVRFYWKGSSSAFWMIDDVEVLGIKACEDLSTSITGHDIYYWWDGLKSFTSLFAKVKGGINPYEYLWSTGETKSLINVSPPTTTDYSVEVTDAQGCKTTASYTVIGKACQFFNVLIAGTDKLFMGYPPKSSTTLRAIVTGARAPYLYLWSTGATTASITVSPTESTNYSVRVTDSNGCTENASFDVTVEDVRCGPRMDKVLLCKSEKNKKRVTVCVPKNEVPLLLWSGASLGACKKSFFEGDTEVTDQYFEPTMSLYPNPSKGTVNIDLKGFSNETVMVTVKDILGRTVVSEQVIGMGESTIHTIELVKSGTYFIHVFGPGVNLIQQVSVIR